MLKEWINSSGVKRADICREVGISPGHLSLLESGGRSPSLQVAVRLQRLSGGVVSVEGWEPAPAAQVPAHLGDIS